MITYRVILRTVIRLEFKILLGENKISFDVGELVDIIPLNFEDPALLILEVVLGNYSVVIFILGIMMAL
jgi:hypothetical protein